MQYESLSDILGRLPSNPSELFGLFSPFQSDIAAFVIIAVFTFVLWRLFIQTWLYWRHRVFLTTTPWTLFEMKIPREIRKSPRAMEQVLAALHVLRNTPGDLEEKYWDGEVTRPFSLEIVTFGGDIHFYVRYYRKYSHLVEASFFSYYSDVELVEVDDYVDRLPANVDEVRAQGYEMWGTEVTLTKPGVYPIRTYPAFESMEEEKQFDPVSTFLEVLGKTKKEEFVGIQILIAPAEGGWIKHYAAILETLKVGTQPKGPPPASGDTAIKDLSRAFLRTPGETDVLKAVESNLSKPAFDTLIRYLYLSPKALFLDGYARRGIMAAFHQYSAANLNSFVANRQTWTQTKILARPYVFPKARNRARKERLIFNYRHREMPPENFMGRLISSRLFHWNFTTHTFHLNTESAATLFHPPSHFVLTAPHIQRVDSRKMGPPAGLAIFGEEEKIEKFM